MGKTPMFETTAKKRGRHKKKKKRGQLTAKGRSDKEASKPSEQEAVYIECAA